MSALGRAGRVQVRTNSRFAAFTNGSATRHILDAAEISPSALEFLEDYADRVAGDRQLASGNRRGGAVSGYELPALIKSLLFVVVDQDRPGPFRFANGDRRSAAL